LIGHRSNARSDRGINECKEAVKGEGRKEGKGVVGEVISRSEVERKETAGLGVEGLRCILGKQEIGSCMAHFPMSHKAEGLEGKEGGGEQSNLMTDKSL